MNGAFSDDLSPICRLRHFGENAAGVASRFACRGGDSITSVPSGRECACRPRPREVSPGVTAQFADTTLDRVLVDDVMAGLPVREFRSYKGRQHYSGWYWSATLSSGWWSMRAGWSWPGSCWRTSTRRSPAIAAQPFLLTGPDGSRIRRHVPDLLLAGADGGVTVVDVKAASRMADPAVAGAVRVDAAGLRRAGLGVRGVVGSGSAAAGQRPVPGWLPPPGAHRRWADPGGARCRGGAGHRSGAIERALSPRYPAGPGPAGRAAPAVDGPVASGPDAAAGRGYAGAAAARRRRMSAGRWRWPGRAADLRRRPGRGRWDSTVPGSRCATTGRPVRGREARQAGGGSPAGGCPAGGAGVPALAGLAWTG